MPAFLVMIMSILSAVVTDMPSIEAFLGGLGKFLATEAAKFWPGGTAAAEVNSIVQFGMGVVRDIDTAVVDVEAEFKTLVPSLEALIAQFPWVPTFLVAHSLVAKKAPAGASATFVIHAQQAAFTNVRVASPAVQKQIADLVVKSQQP